LPVQHGFSPGSPASSHSQKHVECFPGGSCLDLPCGPRQAAAGGDPWTAAQDGLPHGAGDGAHVEVQPDLSPLSGGEGSSVVPQLLHGSLLLRSGPAALHCAVAPAGPAGRRDKPTGETMPRCQQQHCRASGLILRGEDLHFASTTTPSLPERMKL
uniref:Uncharacterized protein n=1 Tax=Stegastes partitus TaxID=144197 RepID=A0A3B4ZCD8_9TELE